MGEPSVRPSTTPERISTPVGLVPLGDQAALSWAAPIQIRLEISFGERQSGRAPVDHHADAAAVGLAERGDANNRPELEPMAASMPAARRTPCQNTCSVAGRLH